MRRFLKGLRCNIALGTGKIKFPRTIDKKRLGEKMGHLDDTVMAEVDNAISVSFGLKENAEER